MECIFCSAPLPKKGLNCNYCHKLNPLNAQLFDNNEKSESQYLCPCCTLNLETLKSSTIDLKYCKVCDGVLISEEEFEKLISYNIDPLSSFNPYYLRFIHDHPRDNRKKSQYQACPICAKKMSVINYKKQSGVILDICDEHGIWLDGGELLQIVEWYAVGGDKKNAIILDINCPKGISHEPKIKPIPNH